MKDHQYFRMWKAFSFPLSTLIAVIVFVASINLPILSCPVALAENKLSEKLIDTPPRGIACLHCMHPSAKSSAASIIQTLVKSRISRPAINYLVDGTFGYDETLLKSHIESLSSHGRKPIIILYLLNGPGQRRFKSKSFKGLATDISPEEFRKMICEKSKTQSLDTAKQNPSIKEPHPNLNKDMELQKQVLQLFDKLTPAIDYALQRGATVYYSPMLEDNLDDQSFACLVSLIKTSKFFREQNVNNSKSKNFIWLRNPCPKCYRGNTGNIPEGVLEEVHTKKDNFNVSVDVVTNDGDQVSNPKLLLPAMKKVNSQGGVFLFWDQKRQGVPESALNFFLPPVDKREYLAVSPSEEVELIELLRTP